MTLLYVLCAIAFLVFVATSLRSTRKKPDPKPVFQEGDVLVGGTGGKKETIHVLSFTIVGDTVLYVVANDRGAESILNQNLLVLYYDLKERGV